MPTRGGGGAPVYLFVVDACAEEEELRALTRALTQALSLLPEESRVGLVTYGTHVHVHELGFTDCPKSYVFRGNKEFTQQQIKDQLTLGGESTGERTTSGCAGAAARRAGTEWDDDGTAGVKVFSAAERV